MQNSFLKFSLSLVLFMFCTYSFGQIKIGGGSDSSKSNATMPIVVKQDTLISKLNPDSNKLNFIAPKEYEIAAEPTIIGAQHMDVSVLLLISGLTKGQKVQVPGSKITDAIKNIWKQGLFEDVQIYANKVEGKKNISYHSSN